MKNSKYTFLQVSSLVILRLLIGWHLLYEGLTKVFDASWSASSFLNASQGPMAVYFKQIAANSFWLEIVNQMNQWGLVLIGLSLILGFLNLWACLAGIILMFLYYISNPPFIGLSQAVAEGSYLIVNKTLIEMVAILVLLVFPTEHIIGIRRLIKKK